MIKNKKLTTALNDAAYRGIDCEKILAEIKESLKQRNTVEAELAIVELCDAIAEHGIKALTTEQQYNAWMLVARMISLSHDQGN